MSTYADPTEDYQTIDRLNARIVELEAALRPFAKCWKDNLTPDDYDLRALPGLRNGHFKDAWNLVEATVDGRAGDFNTQAAVEEAIGLED